MGYGNLIPSERAAKRAMSSSFSDQRVGQTKSVTLRQAAKLEPTDGHG